MELPSIKKMKANLLRHWGQTSNEDTEGGLNWYPEAQRLCLLIAELEKLDYTSVAGVVAVTSPNTFWSAQQWIVPKIIRAWLLKKRVSEVGYTFNKHIKKAYDCLEGNYSTITGNKVHSFWLALCGDVNACVVDRWNARLAIGDNKLKRFPDSWYDPMEQAYREAAHQVGWTVREFQAALWVYAKRTLR